MHTKSNGDITMATSSFDKVFKVDQEAFDKLNKDISEVKNPIKVIDQDLIDFIGFIEWHIEDEVPIEVDDVQKLSDMAKDLIEINAELTKENQKQKGAIEFLASEDELRDLDQSSRHWSVIDEVINNSGV